MADETTKDAPVRTRTATWDDPAIASREAMARPGLDFLRAMVAGELPRPPVSRLLGFDIAEVGEGHAVFEVEPAEHHYNPIGSVHGGVIATLLDSAMGCAIHSLLPAGTGYTTLDLHTTFVRGVRTGLGRLRCVGEVAHLGGRTASARGRLEDADGNLYAHATCTCLVMRPKA